MAVILFVLAVIVSSLLWGKILEQITDKSFDQREIVKVNIASWLLKYVPGQIGAFVWKLQWGSKKGVSKSAVTTSFIYENLLLGISSTLYTVPVIVLILSDGGGDIGKNIALGILIAAGFMIVSLQRVLRFILSSLIKLTRRKVDINKVKLLTFSEFSFLQLFYLIPRIINAVGFVLITNALVSLSASQMVLAGAVYTLAGIIGILAIFVPSGIGVREGVIVLFLSQIVPAEVALVIAINARIYATIADGALALIYGLLNLRRKT